MSEQDLVNNYTWKLKRTVQCAKCPWKVTTNPYEIPYNYNLDKHKSLKDTIADKDDFDFKKPLKVMACHHSYNGKEEHCIGWLHNQLGSGNNILLRLNVRNCENISEIKVIGEQYEDFEDTLPK